LNSILITSYCQYLFLDDFFTSYNESFNNLITKYQYHAFATFFFIILSSQFSLIPKKNILFKRICSVINWTTTAFFIIYTLQIIIENSKVISTQKDTCIFLDELLDSKTSFTTLNTGSKRLLSIPQELS
jgi:hypothetical protein